ncbi:alpha/beta fold hydrolase [Ramlibacter sp. PS3R-8]|uniref:RBBP9/YdeN family alpha/beta hydrolase n=1 Tax=Ramlibacter sp. PS3R-8 TaxID=3133437 RepID=UPI0030AFF533
MAAAADLPTVLVVPGLRDHVAQHWQTLLAQQLPRVLSVPPMGREQLDCRDRVAAIERVAQQATDPVIVVAHSGGCIMVAHWAQRTRCKVRGALLATPPDFEKPMPEGYPTIEALRDGGWLPVPRRTLPFPSIVAASRTDPLGSFLRISALARDWGSDLADLGDAGHLNPASGFGPWPLAHTFIEQLARTDPARSGSARH